MDALNFRQTQPHPIPSLHFLDLQLETESPSAPWLRRDRPPPPPPPPPPPHPAAGRIQLPATAGSSRKVAVQSSGRKAATPPPTPPRRQDRGDSDLDRLTKTLRETQRQLVAAEELLRTRADDEQTVEAQLGLLQASVEAKSNANVSDVAPMAHPAPISLTDILSRLSMKLRCQISTPPASALVCLRTKRSICEPSSCVCKTRRFVPMSRFEN